jgi:hypothetical protein
VNLPALLAAGLVLTGASLGAALYFRNRRKQLALLEFHSRQAEKAYARMVGARTEPEAAAAYSDLNNGFTVAIGLAERLALPKRVEELEKRQAHCRSIYQNQFPR